MVENVVPFYVDVDQAQRSAVVHFPKLLGAEELEEVLACHRTAAAAGDALELNAQNREHKHKRCTFLHGAAVPERGQLVRRAPQILAKLLRAMVDAHRRGGWAGEAERPGPLGDVDVRRLSIRVVELWEYDVQGGLVDDYHYDAGSIITIVCLVNDDSEFLGGVFRTFESDGKHLEHRLCRGDVVCFVSHKYHNITPVLSGRRKSLVIELWQGGVPMFCR